MRLQLNKAHYPVTALGPGTRVGIWVQGCSIHCAGCVSRDTWAPDPARAIEIDELMQWIDGLDGSPIDGVTISGGEPFDQPRALRALADALSVWRHRRHDAVDLLCFSGYPLRRLRREHAGLLGMFDAVIAEPYRRQEPTRLIWRGSANQRLVPLTDLGHARYDHHVDHTPDRPPFQVAVGDGVWYVGVPRAGDMERLLAATAAAGVRQGAASWRP
jgi:anaerobic ribonucleoside-triphosphate reductase activating protein